MIKKTWRLLALFFLVSHVVLGQNPHMQCGVSFLDQPPVEVRAKTAANPSDSIVYLIPVVFHVVWDTLQLGDTAITTNIPDARILEQLEVLNEDYGKFGNGFNQNPVGADTRIRFALAQRDPNGRRTSGITRQYNPEASNVNIAQERILKDLVRWDTRRYLNIWVVKEINFEREEDPTGGNPGVIGGYAYFPQNQAGQDLDGVVIRWEQLGRNARYHPTLNILGRTATHEIGHYFGLFHPWGPRENSNCREDDGLEDTPTCSGFDEVLVEGFSCDTDIFQCGRRRMIENYMDYTPDPCKNLFTEDQKRLMRVNIDRFRQPLVSEENLIQTGIFDIYQQLRAGERRDMVRIYPNPVVDRTLRLYSSLEQAVTMSIRIYNTRGQLMDHYRLDQVEVNRRDIDLSRFDPGLYFYKLQYDVPDSDASRTVEQRGKIILR